MKPLAAIIACLWSGLAALQAQTVSPPPSDDAVLEAIQEFRNRGGGVANEVSVVLDLPDDEEIPTPPTSGNPTPESTPEPAAESTATPAAANPAPEPASPEPRKGLEVRVEKLQTGTGPIDPGEVKLLAPFPAKPLAEAPPGWRLESSEKVPPFTREVELSPGKTITLKIRPHLLVPEADGVNSFGISEPGFDPALGYHQSATVGAILSSSIRQLENDSKSLSAAIDGLQQLLVSLPEPAAEPEPPSQPKNNQATPPRKR
jgi:hypothetical protein